MMFALILLLATLSSVAARCDNACSGHGTCQFDEVCKCFDNWGIGLSIDSGDCSERVCPFEIAWVDTPDISGNTHKYAECAGKGICNRNSGQCECFDGYTGKGCQRTTCPAGCSGHGTCEYIEDLTYGGEILTTETISGALSSQIWDDARASFNYYGWDKKKTRGCVCDAQYADIDCSKRMCPHGTDVLDQRINLIASDQHQVQRLEFVANTPGGDIEKISGQTFAISFRSILNETFTTIPIVFNIDTTDADTRAASETDMCNDMKVALLRLPNKVIDGVSCAAVKDSQTTEEPGRRLDANELAYAFDFTFTGDAVRGKQNLMWVEAYECAHGCTPKITGLDIFASVTSPTDYIIDDGTGGRRRLADKAVAGGANPSDTRETEASDFNNYECGRRGKCDYASGLCDCFSGYTGENCNELTNLV